MKSMDSLPNARKIKAIKEVHVEFENILKQEKCRSCSCLYGDVLNSILEKIKKFRKTETEHGLAKIEDDFERWTKEAALLKMHG